MRERARYKLSPLFQFRTPAEKGVYSEVAGPKFAWREKLLLPKSSSALDDFGEYQQLFAEPLLNRESKSLSLNYQS